MPETLHPPSRPLKSQMQRSNLSLLPDISHAEAQLPLVEPDEHAKTEKVVGG
jgi:hypothetical protein